MRVTVQEMEVGLRAGATARVMAIIRILCRHGSHESSMETTRPA